MEYKARSIVVTGSQGAASFPFSLYIHERILRMKFENFKRKRPDLMCLRMAITHRQIIIRPRQGKESTPTESDIRSAFAFLDITVESPKPPSEKKKPKTVTRTPRSKHNGRPNLSGAARFSRTAALLAARH